VELLHLSLFRIIEEIVFGGRAFYLLGVGCITG